MARRRLNKKVALLGSAVLAIVALGTVLVIFRLTRDPVQFVTDGDAAWAVKDYEAARRNYQQALGLTRASEEKLDLYFKLADVFQATDDWRRVLGCWEQIITSDTKNLKARLGRLKYYYIMADSLSTVGQHVSAYWKDVSSQATELLEMSGNADLMQAKKGTWEPDLGKAEPAGWDGGVELLGAYLHFARGRAALELANMGATNYPAQLLGEAKRDLEEAKRLDPTYGQAYRHLAAVFLAEGKAAEASGNHDLADEATRQADEILAEAIEVAGDEPDPHINFLVRRLSRSQRRGVAEAREIMSVLEPEYQALMTRFSSRPEAFSAAAEFFSFYSAYLHTDVGAAKLDHAIEAIEKAHTLDRTSVKYARMAAALYYRRFSLYGDRASLRNAIDLAESALELPEAQDGPGPRRHAKQTNRFSLCALLATLYLEQALVSGESVTADETLLAKAQKAVHEIEQIQGSGDNPQVVKWQGMLDLARGDRGQAVRRLYAAYEDIKASNAPEERDAFLAYTLAQLFEPTSEVGAVVEFLGAALGSGVVNTKPGALLDYGRALLGAGSYDVALSAVSSFEERFGANPRSERLRIETLLAKGHMTEAEEDIARLSAADPNTLRLRLALVVAQAEQLQDAIRRRQSAAQTGVMAEAETSAEGPAISAMAAGLHDCRRRQATLVEQLLQSDPQAVDKEHLRNLCEALIAQKDIDRAQRVVEAFLRLSPESLPALFYRRLLSEPDPAACSESRRREIHVQAVESLADSVERATELGFFYQGQGRLDEAAEQWRKLLATTTSQTPPSAPAYLSADEANPRLVAAGQLFDIARHRQDWSLAAEMVKVVTSENLDDCQGHLFAGRLALARGQHEEALKHLDECLKLRPVFSYGYMLRGNVQAALGNEHGSVEDTRQAAHLNPTDSLVVKALANALLVRNGRLGDNVSAEQRREVKTALQRAIQANPKDVQVLSAYADVVGQTEPLTALAIRQTIQIRAPSFNNAVVLGRLATRIAVKETDTVRKRAYLTMAERAFEQAKGIDPSNEFMLESYAEYYRVTDQNDKAQQLLVESKDDRLLWRHYYRVGRYAEAKRFLEQLYTDRGSRGDALKGLVLVAEAMSDKAGVEKYSEELLSLQDNAINRLAQVRAYLDVGLVREAERRLQSFKEKYPEEPRLLLMEALLAKRQGQLARALELSNRSLEKNQEDAGTWRLRGEIGLLIGQGDQAILDFRKSRLLQDDPVTTVALANAYVWAGRDQEAISELGALLNEAGAPVQARMLLERIYQRLGRRDALEQLYADALAQFPDDVGWLTRAGSFALKQGHYDEAARLYRTAHQLRQPQIAGRPGLDAPYLAALDGYLHALICSAGAQRGAAGWRPKKLTEVLGEGTKYLDTDYAAVVLCRMAEAQTKLGDSAAAEAYCRQALDRAWGNKRMAAGVLSRVYQLMGAEAVSQYCRQRLQTDPDAPAANFALFGLARIEEDYDDAVGYIDKCIALSGRDTDQELEYLFEKAHLLTLAYKKTSDKRYLEGAIAVYESLVARMPTNTSVLNNLAYMLAQDDRKLVVAERHAKEVLAIDPDNATYLDTYAYVLYKGGKHSEAARAITAAIQQYELNGSASAETYEHLGMIKEALGEEQGALAAYRRALELGDDALSDVAKERIGLAVKRLQ
jgi:tetratricopeptide (TPR) repeat protein